MNDIDQYILQFEADVQYKLIELRQLIIKLVPEAKEAMAYAMPGYKLHGKPLVYFAGYKQHIGFYATPSGHEAFKERLNSYKQGKGSVQFPINQKLPLDLIAEMVLFRAQEITIATGAKKSKK